MPSRYERAPAALHKQALAIMAEHHADLDIAKVSLDVIFAYSGENSAGEKLGPALKHGGYAAMGIAKIVPLLQRVMGRADAQIMLDGDQWDSLHPDQQVALLDHELQHFAVAKDVEGAVITDTHGRPKLKMRLHDYQFGFFTEIAKRHREASQEVIQMVQMYTQAGQILFPFLGQQEMPAIADQEKPARRKRGGKSK